MLRQHHKIKVHIRENAWVARIAAKRLGTRNIAIVFGRTIYLHNISKNDFLSRKSWVLHELKHVDQYRKNGFIGFLFLYLVEYMRNGYYHNRFEETAREAEQDDTLLEQYEII